MLYLVDAGNVIKKMYYSKSRNWDNALNSLIERFDKIESFGDKLIICFDSIGYGTFRKEVNLNYKATRITDNDANAFTRYAELRLNDKYTCYMGPKYEADDVVCTFCHLYPDENIRIISADKDFYSLLESFRVEIVKHIWKLNDTYNVLDLLKEFPLNKPSHFNNVKAIMGDGSDNIEGIKGVGPKTACRLIENCTCQKEIDEVVLDTYPDFYDQYKKNYEMVYKVDIDKEKLITGSELSKIIMENTK